MPQCAITQSVSNSSAFRKHFTPSTLLKAKHQLSPRSNQRCASADVVEIFLEWLPRLKRSIRLRPSQDSRCRSALGQSSCYRRRQSKPLGLLDRDVVTGVGMTQHADAGITVEHPLQP